MTSTERQIALHAKYMAKEETEALGPSKSSDKYGYVSYCQEEELLFDYEGNEIGSKPYMLISHVYVYPEYRCQGHARRLLAEAIKTMKMSGLPIRLAALPTEDNINMEDLVNFYESMGFDVEDTSTDAVVMAYSK